MKTKNKTNTATNTDTGTLLSAAELTQQLLSTRTELETIKENKMRAESRLELHMQTLKNDFDLDSVDDIDAEKAELIRLRDKKRRTAQMLLSKSEEMLNEYNTAKDEMESAAC